MLLRLNWASFPKLAVPNTEIKPLYDVVVIGSGYGGSIAASRCARAGQSVCVLERGKEWRPGDFPEHSAGVFKEFQLTVGGEGRTHGKPNDLFDLFYTDDLTVVQGSGLGGTSLINANVSIDMEDAVFEDSAWPLALRDDKRDLINVDRKHFYDMIEPTPYPDDYPHLQKFDRMEDTLSKYDIEDLDKKILRRLDLYVSFEDKKPNHVGVPQPKCTGCGNCVGGCNVGAKNTLNMNYLPDAKAHGAELFTEVEVRTIVRPTNSSHWLVMYKRVDDDAADAEQTVEAKHVILGAGAIGSTKILLRSKENGLNVSDKLGDGFSTNGDVLGWSFNGRHGVNAIGVHSKAAQYVPETPGPTITTVADFRKTGGPNFDSHHIVEDFGIPNNLRSPYVLGLIVAAMTNGLRKYPNYAIFKKFFQMITGQSDDKSLTFLGMSHDDARGVISVKNGVFDISWNKLGCESNFFEVNRTMGKMTAGLEGMFVRNPIWVRPQNRSVISGHPLGGCSMGESGEYGVVNHAGQVFDGNTNKLMDGLLVVDGSIVPRPVGCNPSLTISMLAERCVRLLAVRENWTIDYDTFKPLVQPN